MERIVIIFLSTALLALFFSRLHFHFHFTLELSRESRSRWKVPAIRHEETKREPKAAPIHPGEGGSRRPVISRSDAMVLVRTQCEKDLSSALVNLGVDKQKAGKLAKQALLEGGEDFDSRIKWAVQHAA